METAGALVRRTLGTCDPNDADAAYNAGIDALEHGLEDIALPLLEEAVRIRPSEPRLWQILGLLHRALDQLDPASRALGEAARLAPRDPLIAHSLARATLESGQPAWQLFEAAHRLAPKDGSILLGRAAAQFAEGRLTDAIAGIDAQLSQHPGWMPGHALLARLRWLAGDRDGFTAGLERALAAAPRDTNLWRELIVTLLHAERFEEALAAIARARSAAGPHIAFDVNEAVCADELGQVEHAAALFGALTSVSDTTVKIRHIRHLLRRGGADEAGAIAEPLLDQPNAHLVWPYLSIIWRLLQDSRWAWLEGDDRLVGIYDVGAELPSLTDLALRLRALHVAIHQPLEQSVRGGTQTDGPLLSRSEPEIRALRQAIVEAVEGHVAQLPPSDPAHPQLRHRSGRIRFSGSWSVRLLDRGHHANHVHPAGWFSSAFYVVVPDETTRGPAPAGWLTLGQPQAELGLDLAPTRHVEPKSGRLVLFPSTMWHGTEPFEAGERMTVAFDVAIPRS